MFRDRSFGSDMEHDRITQALVQHVVGIADACRASAVFVYADALGGDSLPLPEDFPHQVYYVSKTAAEQKRQQERGAAFIRVPNVRLSRLGQVKIAVFLALSKGLIARGDVIVCLAGQPGSGTLDTLIVTEVGREFEMFVSSGGEAPLPAGVLPEVVERVVEIASELGSEGREGRATGALFVIGDAERVGSLSRQLIINPFRGYPEEERNVLDPGLEETVKELSSLDGAFLIRGDGVVETCGALLKTVMQEQYELPQGLGTRHHAAAAITAVTDSLAVTVSASTGTVTIFRGGKIVTDIEKPRNLARLHGSYSTNGENGEP